MSVCEGALEMLVLLCRSACVRVCVCVCVGVRVYSANTKKEGERKKKKPSEKCFQKSSLLCALRLCKLTVTCSIHKVNIIVLK